MFFTHHNVSRILSHRSGDNSKFRLISHVVLHEICWSYVTVISGNCEPFIALWRKLLVALAFCLESPYVCEYFRRHSLWWLCFLTFSKHFLHYNNAWKAFGIFDSGETSTRETKERRHIRSKLTTKSIQVLYTYSPSIKYPVNHIQWQYLSEPSFRNPHGWSLYVCWQHYTDRLDQNSAKI